MIELLINVIECYLQYQKVKEGNDHELLRLEPNPNFKTEVERNQLDIQVLFWAMQLCTDNMI